MATRFISHAQRTLGQLDAKIKLRAVRAGQEYERIWVGLQRLPKSGRIYRIGKTPTRGDRAAGRAFRSHQASAPGEPPAVWFGRLIKSMRRTLHKDGICRYRVRIAWNVRYLYWLEFGTANMRPRPSVRPALRMLRAKMAAIMREGGNQGSGHGSADHGGGGHE